MDEEQANREYKERRDQQEREEIARLKADNLMAQWEVVKAAKVAADAAMDAHIAERLKFTEMLAGALNIKIGMRVTKTVGPTWKRHNTMVKTYEVNKYAVLYNPTQLTLWGRTVKKDGTLGEVFEIGTGWERV